MQTLRKQLEKLDKLGHNENILPESCKNTPDAFLKGRKGKKGQAFFPTKSTQQNKFLTLENFEFEEEYSSSYFLTILC